MLRKGFTLAEMIVIIAIITIISGVSVTVYQSLSKRNSISQDIESASAIFNEAHNMAIFHSQTDQNMSAVRVHVIMPNCTDNSIITVNKIINGVESATPVKTFQMSSNWSNIVILGNWNTKSTITCGGIALIKDAYFTFQADASTSMIGQVIDSSSNVPVGSTACPQEDICLILYDSRNNISRKVIVNLLSGTSNITQQNF